MPPCSDTADVLRVADIGVDALAALAARYSIPIEHVDDRRPIPGSYWGAPEAGLVGQRVIVRADTPVHSVLHELAHVVCMTPARRDRLHTDAGGDDLEECGVCYLQVTLADELPGVGSTRLMHDMDRWGYNFRLGSARAWFADDASDARQFLLEHGLLHPDGRPSWQLRSG